MVSPDVTVREGAGDKPRMGGDHVRGSVHRMENRNPRQVSGWEVKGWDPSQVAGGLNRELA